MEHTKFIKISGKKDGKRIPSRILEEMIQEHVELGRRKIEIDALGQHGIGGRLWKAGTEETHIRITGQSGQRAGSLGYPNTKIEIMGPASDDIGWLNAGSQIIVHGNASNGVMNGAAQGKVFIAGNIGARGMTMTKRNPRFEPPELWILGTAGDYFGEFMAGGIAVICGLGTAHETPAIGYRPFVGMVGGKAFFRGKIQGFSDKDAKLAKINKKDWDWLCTNLKIFLEKINREDLYKSLKIKSHWQLLVARSPQEKAQGKEQLSMAAFRDKVWDKELGQGGLVGDLTHIDRGAIPVIAKGNLRRHIPVWEQGKYIAPCQAACPTGIPVQKRWLMIRTDNIDEAVSMGLEYTPFPATVCGHLCPSPCMASCTRHSQYMSPINVKLLGQAGEKVKLPKTAKKSKKKIAIIGAGPGGISAAWHLTLKGHTAVLFDASKKIGGKISSVIPDTRIPANMLNSELSRVKELIKDIRMEHTIDEKLFSKIKYDYDFTVVAAGAKKPRSLPIPGLEKALFANDFLEKSKQNKIKPGKKIVIIGAGNVGCDVATEAHRLGAKIITLIDIQKPLAFGKEKEDAEAVGAIFKWPCFTEKITKKGVLLQDGELLEADNVIISIGDIPDLDFLGDALACKNGFVSVDEFYRTSDPRVFAIGDAVGPGLITDAIGAGKRTAQAIDTIISGHDLEPEKELVPISLERVSLAYYNPLKKSDTLKECSEDCASCGQCRDCSVCVTVCPEGAITRVEKNDGDYEYKVVDDLCIGCGFCQGACPCGIWYLIANDPL